MKNTAAHSLRIASLRICAALFLFTALSSNALGATVSPSVVDVSSKTGKIFTVEYSINPENDVVYTAGLRLRYPADLLALQSFAFTPGMIPLSQPGYDEINNKTGVSNKTAGYPKGISKRTVFGMATFVIVGEGSGTISLAEGSFAFNEIDANVLVSLSSASTKVVSNSAFASTTIVSSSEPAPVLFDILATQVASDAQGKWWMLGFLFISFLFLWILLYQLYAIWKKRNNHE